VTERSRNKYLSKICVSLGTEDPQEAIERLLRCYRNEGDTLEAIATKCGVAAIIEEPLSFEGGIFQLSDDRIVIKLNSYANLTRRKFTLAHEIGHLLLSSLSKKGNVLKCSESAGLERACDAIAAELLMPAVQVRLMLADLKGSSPQNLRILANRFGVSLQAAARRVHEDLRLWARHIGMWKCDSVPQEMWFVGKRPWGTRNPEFAAFDTARTSRQVVRSFDVTRAGDRVRPISLELLNLGGDYILGLVGVVS
jgi:IrrE N-terminal-like domain